MTAVVAGVEVDQHPEACMHVIGTAQTVGPDPGMGDQEVDPGLLGLRVTDHRGQSIPDIRGIVRIHLAVVPDHQKGGEKVDPGHHAGKPAQIEFRIEVDPEVGHV